MTGFPERRPPDAEDAWAEEVTEWLEALDAVLRERGTSGPRSCSAACSSTPPAPASCSPRRR